MVLLLRRLRFKRMVMSVLVVIASFVVIDSILHKYSQYILTPLRSVGLNVHQEKVLLTVNVINQHGQNGDTAGSRQNVVLKVANNEANGVNEKIGMDLEDSELLTTQYNEINPNARKQMVVTQQPTTAKQDQIDALLDPYQFHYVINEPETCTTKIELLIYAHSAPQNKKRRRIVRQTWGNGQLLEKYNTKLRFFMGSRTDQTIMDEIKNESIQYRDIIQDSYIDSYRNLTYKGISTLKWIRTYCPNNRIVVKIDDDVIVNVVNATKYIKGILKSGTSCDGWLECYVENNALVQRNSEDKWSLTKEEFPYKRYPPYCSGVAVILSNDTIEKLFAASIGQPYFWIDDVFLFGMVAQKAGLKHRRFDFIFSDTLVLDDFRQGKPTTIMFTHSIKLNTIYLLWHIIQLRTPELNAELSEE